MGSASLWARDRTTPRGELSGSRTGKDYEAMREVFVDSERLLNTELLHHDEAQAVHEAVLLVLIALQVFKGGALLFLAGSMDARQPLAERLSPIRTASEWRLGGVIRMRVMVSETT